MVQSRDDFFENDIRPDPTKGQEIAVAHDIEKLLSREKEFVFVDCPACGAHAAREKFRKNGFIYSECKTCDTFYINPRPTPEILEDFLLHSENYEYWNRYIFPASADIRKEKIVVPRVERVLQLSEMYRLSTDALLEVGAGSGLFCEEMGKRGVFKRIVAVEPSTTWAETCKKKGIETIALPIEKVSFPSEDLFTVIVNFEVIEHLFSPKDFIMQCKKCLKPGGILLLTCPNGKGFDIETLGVISDTVDHEHLNYFNPRSLALLFEKCDFEVIESITPGKLDAELVRNKAVEGAYDLSSQPFLREVLIDRWKELGKPFQDFISQHGLSSNMWLVGRKKRGGNL